MDDSHGVGGCYKIDADGQRILIERTDDGTASTSDRVQLFNILAKKKQLEKLKNSSKLDNVDDDFFAN